MVFKEYKTIRIPGILRSDTDWTRKKSNETTLCSKMELCYNILLYMHASSDTKYKAKLSDY